MRQVYVDMVALKARLNALELEVSRINECMRSVGLALIGTPSAISPRQDSDLVRASVASPKVSRAMLKPAKTGTAAFYPAAVKKSTAAAVPKPNPEAETVVAIRKAIKPKAGVGSTKWFKPGEAVKLFQRILKQPMKFGNLYARVLSSKRKSDLSSEEMGRFKWAVEAAVKAAIKAKALSRSSDGLIAVVSDEGPPADNVDGKSAKKARTKKPAAQ